jgi:hypothetical protein
MTGKQRVAETRKSAATSQKNSSNLTKPRLLTSASLDPVLQLQQTIGNRAVLRLLQSGKASLLRAQIVQRKPVFKSCKGKEETLSSAIAEAKKLASAALLVLKGERLEVTEKEHVRTALKNNFGDVTDKQKTTITERYAKMNDTLDGKEITCINKKKTDKKGHVPGLVEKGSGAFFRLVKCTTNTPPCRAATGGTRHGQGYQQAGRSA